MKHILSLRKRRGESLAALVRQIDAAVDDYASDDHVCAYPFEKKGRHMQALLKALRNYHPLDVHTREHGCELYYKLYVRQRPGTVELMFDLYEAFEMVSGYSHYRWNRGWWHRYVVRPLEKKMSKMKRDRARSQKAAQEPTVHCAFVKSIV